MPEIEMPGHSGAALAAYPQLGFPDAANGTDMPISIYNPRAFGLFNPANEETIRFLEDVLAEVFTLFPGQYVHIGADEVRTSYWARNAECQALMRREHLKSGDELQSWLIKRIEKFAHANGKDLVGWSEIANTGLAQNTVVMDWNRRGWKAAMQGREIVMTPISSCFLNNNYQSTNYAAEPFAQRGFVSLQNIYMFEPVPTNLPSKFQPQIIGAQATLWTEWIASLPHVEYMLFPRLCALSEVVWSSKASRNWSGFQSRLQVDEHRLDKLGVNYRHDPATQLPPSTTRARSKSGDQ